MADRPTAGDEGQGFVLREAHLNKSTRSSLSDDDDDDDDDVNDNHWWLRANELSDEPKLHPQRMCACRTSCVICRA